MQGGIIMSNSSNRATALAAMGCAAVICGTLAVQAFGASTDISNVPLSSSSNALVKPNLLFTLDSSGSMDWDYMGDNVNPDDSKNTGTDKAYTCRNDVNGNNNCYAGDPP